MLSCSLKLLNLERREDRSEDRVLISENFGAASGLSANIIVPAPSASEIEPYAESSGTNTFSYALVQTVDAGA